MILQRFSSANVYRVLISSAYATGFYWPIQSLAPDKWPCSSSPQNVYTSRADPGLLDNQHPPESPSRDTPGKSPGTPRAHPGQKPGGPGTPRAASGASMGHAVPLHRSTVPDIKEPKVSHPAKQDFIHTRALPSSSDQPALVGRETILNRSIQQIKPHAYRVRAPASRLELEGCILP